MSFMIRDLLSIAHDLEMHAHTLRTRHQPEVARQVTLAVDLLRKEIDVIIAHYERQQMEP